jgi:hypothetical protein
LIEAVTLELQTGALVEGPVVVAVDPVPVDLANTDVHHAHLSHGLGILSLYYLYVGVVDFGREAYTIKFDCGQESDHCAALAARFAVLEEQLDVRMTLPV